MRRPGLIALVIGLVGIGLFIPLLLMLMAVGGLPDDDGGTDCGGGAASVAMAAGDGELSPPQVENASVIASVGRDLGMPDRALVIALAVAHQESGFRNYANDGLGADLTPAQQGIRASLRLPHDAVGSDHGSLGIFQQQWPWWGSMSELMEPRVAAQKFYASLAAVPGWVDMSITEAGQAVQHSAHPDAYSDDVPTALALLGLSSDDVDAVEEASYVDPGLGSCATTATYAGDFAFPLPANSGYTNLHNWGSHGSHWSSRHTGTDLSVSCGTPVLTATAGTVVIRTDQAWAGRWLLEVSTGVGSLTTWYGHMQAVDVSDGEEVQAGQQIGEVGDLGNATGCHLHFEVHSHGGPMYEDDVDPSTWLEGSSAQEAGTTVQPVSTVASSGFRLATFNALGHSHTAPGGNKPGWAPSSTRTRWAVGLFDLYGVDVVGLQEFQPTQKRAFLSTAGDRYEVYSPPGDTDNAIAWRRARWQLISASALAIPYFDGHPRPMPVVRLRDRETGSDALFVNIHNPADTSRFHNQGRFRTEAVRREAALVQGLTAEYGLPVFLTGDFNARDDAFCGITAVGMAAAAGGSNTGYCAPPDHAGVDWIFGSSMTALGRQAVVSEAVKGRISDHPFVIARVASVAR